MSNVVLDSLKFKKLLDLHVFYNKPLYKQPSLELGKGQIQNKNQRAGPYNLRRTVIP